MKHLLLASAVLLGGAVGLASADYILITANIGQSRGAPATGPNGPGPGPAGTGGPMGGMPPGGGIVGGPRPGQMGGQMGGMPGQMGGLPGMIGGLPGQMGGLPGQMGGQGGGAGDGPPIEILAVVEVKTPFKTLEEYKAFVYDPGSRQPPHDLPAVDHWGTAFLLNIKPGWMSPDVKFEGVQCQTVMKKYEQQYNQIFASNKPDSKPSEKQITDLAEFALTHGLNDKFVELMKKLAEVDKDHPVVAAFNQLQADLDKPIKDAPSELRKSLGDAYTEATLKDAKGQDAKGHYVLFFSVTNNDAAEVQERLGKLEDSLHTFYYWFALKGPDLILHRTVHTPEERLPALLALADNEFLRQHGAFSSPPVVGDGFFARRENVSVFCARPQDPTYDMLNTATAATWSGGWDRYEILSGKDKVGYPPKDGTIESRAYAGMLALLLKALEDESARAGISHDSTRQLLFASGLLPRGVTVPEWVQFGMGSFFETPVHSPWPSPAGKSALYLPIFRDELGDKGTKFEGDAYKTMKKVVTDGYFRELKPEDLKKRSPDLLRARAATWSLMYFLTQRRLDHLQHYFQLLAMMPRDLELDDDALWECYARAFDAYDPKTKQFDEAKLGNLAAEWQGFVLGEQFGTPEDEALMAKLHKAYENLNKVQEGGKPIATGPSSGKPMGTGAVAP